MRLVQAAPSLDGGVGGHSVARLGSENLTLKDLYHWTRTP